MLWFSFVFITLLYHTGRQRDTPSDDDALILLVDDDMNDIYGYFYFDPFSENHQVYKAMQIPMMDDDFDWHTWWQHHIPFYNDSNEGMTIFGTNINVRHIPQMHELENLIRRLLS